MCDIGHQGKAERRRTDVQSKHVCLKAKKEEMYVWLLLHHSAGRIGAKQKFPSLVTEEVRKPTSG
jgi:hypothetical protein